MRVVGKVRTIKSRALTDPTPQFVSLVSAGANMTPFAVTKSEQEKGAEGMSVRTRTRKLSATALDNKLIHPLQTTAVKQEGVQVAQISFKRGEAFPDRNAVMDWLDNGGYTEYELVETKSEDGERIVGWRVDNSAVAFDGEPKAIDAGRGVTLTVGKVKAAEPEKKETDEKTKAEAAQGAVEANAEATADTSEAKTEEPATKIEEAGDSVGAVSAEAAPGTEETAAKGGDPDKDETVQPGANSEAATAAEPAAKSEETTVVAKKSIYTLDSLTDVVSALQWIASDAAYDELFAGADSAISDRIKQLSAEMLLVIAQVAQAEAAALATKSEAPKAEPTLKIEEIVAAAVQPIANTMAEALKSISTSIGALSTKVEETKSSVEKRVEALESRAQTRKGADIETSIAPTAETQTSNENSKFVKNLSLRSAMGLGHRK